MAYNEYITKMYDMLGDIDEEAEICYEVYWSTLIEGSATPYERVHAIYCGDDIQFDNYHGEKIVYGYFSASRYLQTISGNINVADVLFMWELLIGGRCVYEDIAGIMFSKGDIIVGNRRGFPFPVLKDMVKRWCDYYNSTTFDEYPFIKACILHFTFNSIQPFIEGNRRLSRLLMCNYLISRGYDRCRALAFSRAIGKHLSEYSDAFLISDNSQHDITPFIEYMLDCIYATLYVNVN